MSTQTESHITKVKNWGKVNCTKDYKMAETTLQL